MTKLKKITVQYVETEDRLRLLGEVLAGPVVVLWLTQRLIRRLIPQLCKCLEQELGTTPMSEIKQEFAQQKARVDLERQFPVRFEMDAEGVLVQSINLTPSSIGINLQFRDKGSNILASFQFQPKSLRQWLNILYDQCLGAGWPTDTWPTWMSESARQQKSVLKAILH